MYNVFACTRPVNELHTQRERSPSRLPRVHFFLHAFIVLVPRVHGSLATRSLFPTRVYGSIAPRLRFASYAFTLVHTFKSSLERVLHLRNYVCVYIYTYMYVYVYIYYIHVFVGTV